MNAINTPRSDVVPTSKGAGSIGAVSLVGAGPGAADLLTIRAAKALESADVVYWV